ncbi:MAG: AAA family ATPase [Chloroflexi bacterium]|nr:AAA family ATPase [Chloroflexota bacterium]
MFLKKLELQGFKTFANRTEFEFGRGVTAVIGPNGSGKSNIADSVRWVLGEQSGRLLRTKRAEDVIFAGSSQRPPAGMSQVTLTLDNSSGWLPLDFAEVTIGRRVFRTGESEYYINRSKVRLRDVVDLLLKANVGQNNYTVIGQGLIDSALSLRPEERRGLIEEAADLKRHYTKIDEARSKLEATLQNLARARDILAEVGPRMNRLQRQASQAAEYGRLTKELSSLLTIWYYRSWQKASASLLAGREAAGDCQANLRHRQEELATLSAGIEETRSLRTFKRGEVGLWQKERGGLAARLDGASRQLAVDGERLASFARQERELAGEIESLNGGIVAETEALAAARERLTGLLTESGSGRDRVLASQGEMENHNARQADLQTQLSQLREQSSAASSLVADLGSRLHQLEERDARLSAEVSGRKVEDERLRAAIGEKLDLVAELRQRLDASARDLSDLAAERESHLLSRRETHARIKEIETKVGEAQREAARLQSQFETLAKLQDSFTGLYTGVRTVLQAAAKGSVASGQRSGDERRGPENGALNARGLTTDHRPLTTDKSPTLRGIVGIVASLIEVPQNLEAAIEVALGGHLQDIVVEKWAHAEEAIEFLKRTRGGRATFLPLDSVRVPSGRGRVLGAPNLPGVIGVAADLVKYDARLMQVIRQLLGQTVVVENLAVARKVMEGLAGAGQIVTLSGEIVRSNGSLTGGATRLQAEGAMLFRVRGLRELPEQIGQVVARQRDLERSLGAERDGERQLDAKLADLEAKERRLGQSRRALEEDEAKAGGAVDRLRQEAEFQSRLDRQADAERAEMEAKRRDLIDRLAEATRASGVTRSRLVEQQQAMEAFLTERAKDRERFNDLRTSMAVMEKAIESERNVVAERQAALRRQEAQKEAKLERSKSLSAEASQLEAEAGFLRSEKADLDRQVEALDACIEPALIRLTELDAEETVLLAEESDRRAKVLEAERQLVQANSVVRRCDEDLANLRERMEAEGIDLLPDGFPFAEGTGLGGQAWQLSLGLRGGTATMTENSTSGSLQVMVEDASGNNGGERGLPLEPPVQTAADPAVMKRRIDRLRSQLRSIGPVNASVIDEYEETRSRHDFLDVQIRDLTQSEASLRDGIALLEAEAKKRFDEAFETLGREFKQFFAQLFGGGTAKLVRADEGDGIDIVAQPPGKRLQSLSLLSGGERALTATALLFAILKVNPAPFCMLDEVDAALDESNVGRFVDALKRLSANTQFIVITHNRGTVEVADTLYGISMGSDGVSKMVSLKLSESR